MLNGNPIKAFDYLARGAGLLLRPGMRRFVIIPLLINLLLFVVATLALVHFYQDLLQTLVGSLPEWLAFFAWLLWLIFALVLLIFYGYTFNIITNIVAAPFYGILAEKIEQAITGATPTSETLAQLIPRTIQREILKLWYFISRGFLLLAALFVLWFIPGLNILAAGISALWAAWCMAVQYLDYPADNHQTTFKEVRRKLLALPLTSYSFGGLVMLGSMIPIANIFIMPVAVAGATVYWLEEMTPGKKRANA